MPLPGKWAAALGGVGRFLTFRKVDWSEEGGENRYLAIGIVSAWLAGMGRYWDNPRADLWQHLGLGSIVYVFALALLLWLLILPLGPRNWRYKQVATFVGLTAPPGILYAIPVERFLPLEMASAVNVWFLALVALWRVALLFLHLRRTAGLSPGAVAVAGLLPLVLVVSALAFLNLEHVIFRIMAGLAAEERTANDAAYAVLLLITAASYAIAPFLVVGYGWLIWARRRSRVRAQRAAGT